MIIRTKPKTIWLRAALAGVLAILAFVEPLPSGILLICAGCFAASAYGHSGRYLRFREDGIEIKRRFAPGIFLGRGDIESVGMTWVHRNPVGSLGESTVYLGIRLKEASKEAYRIGHAKNAAHFDHHVLLAPRYGLSLNEMETILRSWLKEPSLANQPVQHNAGSRPSSDDSSASETPSSLGPRG